MALVPLMVATALLSPAQEAKETHPVRILRAVLAVKEIERHLGDRYFSGDRAMIVIGAMLPEGEIEIGSRRFALYKTLPSDTGRVPAGMNIQYMAIKPAVAETVVRLPADEVGYRVRLQQERGKWIVMWTKPVPHRPASDSSRSASDAACRGRAVRRSRPAARVRI